MGQFNETEKERLKELLSDPLLKQAMQSSLISIYAEGEGSTTIEAAAMAHRYERGAVTFFNNLHQLASMPAPAVSTLRKLRPEKDT